MQRTSPIHKGRGLSPPGVAAHLAEPTIALPAGLAQSSRDRAGTERAGTRSGEPGGRSGGPVGAGGARQTGGPAGGSGRGRGDPQPICRLPEPASAARLSRAPAAGPAGRGQMSDTFKGWKQSIFQSDHLKHLGNYTLKISVINSPESAAITAPGCPALAHGPAAGPACRHWNRAPEGHRAPGGHPAPGNEGLPAMEGGKSPLCFSPSLGGGRSARANKREGKKGPAEARPVCL